MEGKTLKEIVADLKRVPAGQESRNETERKIRNEIIKRVDEISAVVDKLCQDLSPDAEADPDSDPPVDDTASDEGEGGTGSEDEEKDEQN